MSIDPDTDLKFFIKTANQYPVLSPEAERDLLIILRGSKSEKQRLRARDKLAKHNLSLVISVAKKYINKGLPLVDLIQEGWVGLVTGIDKFDITRTRDDGKFLKLSTYVTWWIRQAITRAIANQGKAIRVPINIQAEYTKVQILYGRFVEATEVHPNAEELSILYNTALEQEQAERRRDRSKAKKPLKLKPKTAEEISELGKMFHPVMSLDEPSTEDENLTLLDYISDTCDPHDNVLELTENKKYLEKILSCLNEEDKNYIKIRYGLIDGKSRDRKTMSALKKMTQEEIDTKEEEIFDKLKLYANKNRINLNE